MGVMALIASIIATTACQKDNADETWRQIPVDQITVESGKAVVTVNEIPETDGTVQFVAENEDDATLNMTGIVPGYAEIQIGVDLQKQSDDTFAFKGSTILSTPPSIAATLRSTEENPCYAVNVEGTITIEGVVNVAVTTQVQGASVSLTGTWNLTRQSKVDLTLTPVNGPVHITWKAAGAAGTAVSAILPTVNMLACQLVAETLDQVTFDESGNIMAKYYEDLDLGDDPMAAIKALVGEIKPDLKGNVTFKAHHIDWTTSPKANLAFWYAFDNSLFVVPNVSAIAKAADDFSDSRADIQGTDISSFLEILNALKEYGVDVNTINAELQKILSRGIELKYSLEGGNLKIYVDKSLCDPMVTALIPALSVLDTLLEQLSQSNDPEDQKIVTKIKLIMGILGLEKPSDLGTLWKATTEFEFALNLNNQTN